MTLDVRLPIGLLLVTLGALLTGYGAVGAPVAPHSLGINVDLVWGAALLAVGAVMLLLARRARTRQ